MLIFLVTIFVLPSETWTADPLEKLNIDPDTISVSGFSAGGDMTSQMHVAFSSTIKGAGVMSGSPFWCARGLLSSALGACMENPQNIAIAPLKAKTEEYAQAGDIDDIENLKESRIYIYNGQSDGTRNVGTADKVEEYYKEMGADPRRMKKNVDLDAGHGYPTMNEGNLCGTAFTPYINRCDFNGAYEMLNHLYFGNLVYPDGTSAQGELKVFDQTDFFALSPSQSSMADEGLIYIPPRCQDGTIQCKLHVVFHGCQQDRGSIGDDFATRCGFNEIGDVNDMVFLYPQTIKSPLVPYNPNGCFDWWGYTNARYATRSGNQMAAIQGMIEKVAGIEM